MLLLIDKPKGLTSHDAVDFVRRETGEKKVGHAGTLDPMASGLLIIAVGRDDTKKLGKLTKETKKTYIAEITLGTSTTTDDTEGNILETKKAPSLNEEDILKVLKTFEGVSMQIPPIYSAIKKDGKKAYEVARAGKEIEMEPRRIEIFKLELIEYENAMQKLFIMCEVSAGTYIRALARDLGQALGTVAHLSNLRRTNIGEYDVSDATYLENFSGKSYNK